MIDLSRVPGGTVLDHTGRRAQDSSYRANYIFGVQNAILVTLHFHLDRALHTCDKLGIDVVGGHADRRPYVAMRFWWLRELVVLIKAWFDLNFLHPTPVLGDKLPVE